MSREPFPALSGEVVLRLSSVFPFFRSLLSSHSKTQRSSCPVLFQFSRKITHRFLRGRDLVLTRHHVLVSFCDRIVIQRICICLCQRRLHILSDFLHTHPMFLRQFPIYLPHAHRNLLHGKNYNRLFFLIISDNIIFFNQNKRYNRSFLPCTELKINTLGGHQNG